MADKPDKQHQDIYLGLPLLCPNPKCWSPEKPGKGKGATFQIELFQGQDRTGYCKKCGWIVKRCQNKLSFGKTTVSLVDCQACNETAGRFCRWCGTKRFSTGRDKWEYYSFTGANKDPESQMVTEKGLEITITAMAESNEVFSGGHFLKVGNYLVCIAKNGDVFRISPCLGSTSKVPDLKIKGTSGLDIHGVDHYLLASGSNNAFIYNSALDLSWQLDFQKNLEEKFDLLSGLSVAYPKAAGRGDLLLAIIKSKKGSREKFFLASFSLLPREGKLLSIRNKIELKIPEKESVAKFQIFYIRKSMEIYVLILNESGFWQCPLDALENKISSSEAIEFTSFTSPGNRNKKSIFLPIKTSSTEHCSSEWCDRNEATRLEFFVETLLLDQESNLLNQNPKVEQIVFHLPERNQNFSSYFNEIREGSVLDQMGETVAFLSNSSGQGTRPVFQFGFMGQENTINEISNYSAGLVFLSPNMLAWKAGNNKVCIKKIGLTGVTKTSEFGAKAANHYFEVDGANGYPFCFDRALVFPTTKLENQRIANQLLIHWFQEEPSNV